MLPVEMRPMIQGLAVCSVLMKILVYRAVSLTVPVVNACLRFIECFAMAVGLNKWL
jgi:hypothetical protein